MPLPFEDTGTATADASGNATFITGFTGKLASNATLVIELLVTTCASLSATGIVKVGGSAKSFIQAASFGQVPGILVPWGQQLEVDFQGMTPADTVTINVNGKQYAADEDVPPWVGIAPISAAPSTARSFLQRNVAVGSTPLVPAIAGKGIIVYDLMIWPLGNVATGGNVSIDDQSAVALLFMPTGANPTEPWHRDFRPGITTVENTTTPLTSLNAHVGAGGPNSDFYAIAAYQ